jgi:cyclopropane fatty-acyl-phospholipid synthase-like methyltransferase
MESFPKSLEFYEATMNEIAALQDNDEEDYWEGYFNNCEIELTMLCTNAIRCKTPLSLPK